MNTKALLCLVSLFLLSTAARAQEASPNASKQKEKATAAVLGSRSDLEVGDILMSLLDLKEFQQQHGGSDHDWVQCDGKTYPESTWGKKFNNRPLPDLSGRYPRGTDPQNVTGLGLPKAGDKQDDAFKDHKHWMWGWATMNDAQGGGDNQVPRIGYGGKTPTTGAVDMSATTEKAGPTKVTQPEPEPKTSSKAGADPNETRPKTTMLNFYCRIN